MAQQLRELFEESSSSCLQLWKSVQPKKPKKRKRSDFNNGNYVHTTADAILASTRNI